MERASEFQKDEKMQASEGPRSEVQSDFMSFALDNEDLADELCAKQDKTEKCQPILESNRPSY